MQEFQLVEKEEISGNSEGFVFFEQTPDTISRLTGILIGSYEEIVAPSARRGLPPASSGLDVRVLGGVGSLESVPLGAELSAVVVHWREVPTNGGIAAV